jgi:hypothetical protein
MNIVKLQNELKGVPDQALIGYVQNPTGQVPTYLALSELQRRKEMRNSYQANKPAEKTVAQGLVDEAQPQPQPMQQGIAAMAPQQAPAPAPMPQAPMAPPQGMAGGGMVSFADGGDTNHYLDSQAPLNLGDKFGSNQTEQDMLRSLVTSVDPNDLRTLLPFAARFENAGKNKSFADGGIAGLDTGNMYDEQIYAQGGIVAFADGGSTEENHYLDSQAPLNLGDRVQGSNDVLGSMNPNDPMVQQFFKPGIEKLRAQESALYGNGPNSILNTMDRNDPMAQQMLIPGIEKLRAINSTMYGTAPLMSTDDPMGRLMNSGIDKMRAGHSALYGYAEGGEVKHYDEGGTSRLGDWWSSKMNQYDIDRQINDLMAEKNKYRFDYTGTYKPEERAAKEARNQEIDTKVATLKAQRSGAPVTPSAAPSANVLGSQASADKLAGLQYDPSQALNIKSPAIKSPLAADGTDPYALEKVKGIADYGKELKDYIGTDPMRAQLQERLSKMDTAAAKQADQAPWMALAQAGFGMAAGKSPNALLNIAEGAGAGLKDYATAKEKMAALEEKRFGLLADIAKQDRAETIAIAKFGADSKQAIEERNAKAKLQQAHDKVLMKMNTEDNNVKLASAITKTAMDAKDIVAAKEKVRAGDAYINWKNEIIKDKGKNIVNTPEFKRAEEDKINELVRRESSLASSTIDTSQWSLAQPQR